jgi:pantothenate kinase type III
MASEQYLLIHIGKRWTQVYYESLNLLETNPEWTASDVAVILGDYQFLGASLVEKVVISSHVKELTPVFQQYAKKTLQTEAIVIHPRLSTLPLADSTPTDVVGVIHSHGGEVVYIGVQEHLTICYVNDGYFQGYFQGPDVPLTPTTQMPPRLHLAKTEEAAEIHGAINAVLGSIDSALRTIRPHQDAKVILYGPLAKWLSPYIEDAHQLDPTALFRGLSRLIQHVR